MARIVVDSTLETRRFEQGANRMRRIGRDAAQGVAGAFRGALAGGLLAAGMDRVAKSFDRVGKLAARFGVDTKFLQEAGFAAEIYGGNLEGVARGMNVLLKNTQEAKDGAALYADEFAALGIEVEAFSRLDLAAKLSAIATAVTNATDKERAQVAVMNLMGRSAGELLPMLRDVEGMMEAMGKATVVDAEDIKAMEDYNDAMTELKTGVMGFTGTVLGALIRGYKAVGDEASLAAMAAADFGRSVKMGQGFNGSVARAVDLVDRERDRSFFEEAGELKAGPLRDFSAVQGSRNDRLRAAEDGFWRDQRRRGLELGESASGGGILSMVGMGTLMARVAAAAGVEERGRLKDAAAVVGKEGLLEELRSLAFGGGEIELGANRGRGSNEVSSVQADARSTQERILKAQEELVREIKGMREDLERRGEGLAEFEF